MWSLLCWISSSGNVLKMTCSGTLEDGYMIGAMMSAMVSSSLPLSDDICSSLTRIQWLLLCNPVSVDMPQDFMFHIKAIIISGSRFLASQWGLKFISFGALLDDLLMSTSIYEAMVLLTGRGKSGYGKRRKRSYGL